MDHSDDCLWSENNKTKNHYKNLCCYHKMRGYKVKLLMHSLFIRRFYLRRWYPPFNLSLVIYFIFGGKGWEGTVITKLANLCVRITSGDEIGMTFQYLWVFSITKFTSYMSNLLCPELVEVLKLEIFQTILQSIFKIHNSCSYLVRNQATNGTNQDVSTSEESYVHRIPAQGKITDIENGDAQPT